MSDNNWLFYLSMCGLSVVCLGILGLLFLPFVRRIFAFIPALIGLISQQTSGDDPDHEIAPSAKVRRSRPDLRQIAAQNDFDSALRAQGVQPAQPVNVPAPPLELEPLDTDGLLEKRNISNRPQRRSNDEEDGIFDILTGGGTE